MRTGPARLWLVRHAQPLIAPGVCYGALDMPAEPRATADSAHRLNAALPPRLHWAAHSPLRRCEQLAQALRELRPDMTLEPCLDLAEFDFGQWEGRAWDAIARHDLDAWTAQFAHYRPGGGDSLAAMLRRVSRALCTAQTHALRNGGDVLWITHAGVARCVQWLLGAPAGALPCADQWPVQAPGYGQWMRLALPAVFKAPTAT